MAGTTLLALGVLAALALHDDPARATSCPLPAAAPQTVAAPTIGAALERQVSPGEVERDAGCGSASLPPAALVAAALAMLAVPRCRQGGPSEL
jgi:hypothetical protein